MIWHCGKYTADSVSTNSREPPAVKCLADVSRGSTCCWIFMSNPLIKEKHGMTRKPMKAWWLGDSSRCTCWVMRMLMKEWACDHEEMRFWKSNWKTLGQTVSRSALDWGNSRAKVQDRIKGYMLSSTCTLSQRGGYWNTLADKHTPPLPLNCHGHGSPGLWRQSGRLP